MTALAALKKVLNVAWSGLGKMFRMLLEKGSVLKVTFCFVFQFVLIGLVGISS